MRIHKRAAGRTSRGKIIVITAILIPAIMGFMALSTDVAVIATARAQLRIVSDAAALSGAMKLADDQRVMGPTDLSPEIAGAQTQAKLVGQDNLVLNTTPVIMDNASNSSSGDVVVGSYDPRVKTWVPPPITNPALGNAVLVNASRSTSHGGMVPGFFSRAWGYGGTTISVQSIAMAWNYPVQGFRPPKNTPGGSSANANLLPIVLDKTTWLDMMAGTTTDQYTYNSGSKTVTLGADGITESKLYPVASGSPGNWGTINVGVTENSTSILQSQIMYGITPSQLAMYPSSTIALDNSQSPPSITFSGNPGISAALKESLDSIIGKPVTIPIYDQSGSEGNNAWYRVIAFQPCRILSVDFQGAAKYVIIQPCLIKDGSAIAIVDPSKWPANWSWKWGGVVRVHLVE